MSTVAVLGMGAMGSRMARSALAAGHSVRVWNRTPEKAAALGAEGADVAETPREAAAGAALVLAMLRDDEASREVWLHPETGALAGLGEGAVAVESSTLTVGWVRALGTRCRAAGVSFLDAPVAGSRPQAEAGQLIFLVGGEAEALGRAEPVLKAMGGAVHHAGPEGSGATVKLMVNALFGVQVAALAELIGLAHACGIDEARAVEILSATPVCSPAAKAAAGSMLAQSFAPMFPVELVEKDFGYVEETARAGGAEVPVAAAVRRVLATAMARGYGADNLTGISRLYLGEGQGAPARSAA